MTGGHRAKDTILPSIIGHQVRGAVHMRLNDRLERFGSYIGDVEGTDSAFALDQCKDRVLVCETAMDSLVSRFLSPKGLIGFHSTAISSQWPLNVTSHSEANPVQHKQGR